MYILTEEIQLFVAVFIQTGFFSERHSRALLFSLLREEILLFHF